MEHDGDPGYVHDLYMWKDKLIMGGLWLMDWTHTI